MALRISRLFRWLVLPALIGVVLYFSRATWCAWLGEYLVDAGPPVKADMVVVLAGDSFGNRILKAAEMVRQGDAPAALVSGPSGTYGNYESDLAIPFAVKAGYPEGYFIGFRHQARSTAEEAGAIVAELRKRNVHSIDLVTSDYHTRRAGAIFRDAARGIEIHVVAARDENFSADGWWRTREGRKVFLNEWLKTVANWFHI